MPSYKPKVQVLLTPEYHEKFKILCDQERRSDSVMGAIMIEKYINDYELEHGTIQPKSSAEIWKEQMDMLKNPNISPIEKLKQSTKRGLKFGDKSAQETKEILEGNEISNPVTEN